MAALLVNTRKASGTMQVFMSLRSSRPMGQPHLVAWGVKKHRWLHPPFLSAHGLVPAKQTRRPRTSPRRSSRERARRAHRRLRLAVSARPAPASRSSKETRGEVAEGDVVGAQLTGNEQPRGLAPWPRSGPGGARAHLETVANKPPLRGRWSQPADRTGARESTQTVLRLTAARRPRKQSRLGQPKAPPFFFFLLKQMVLS